MDDDDDYFSGDYSDVEVDDTFEDGTVEDDDGSRSSLAPSTQVITQASLLAAQNEDLKKVMDLLPLSQHHARTLLIHHRWDVERLLTELVDKGRDKLFLDAGVSITEKREEMPGRSSSPFTCSICFEYVSSDGTTTMECGHCFCNDCWTGHFIVKINDGQSRRIKCMAEKCNAICDEATVRSLVSVAHPEIASRFERFLLESYIEDNNKVKWCPSVPHCGNAIRIDSGEVYCEVECTCGQQFCFSCLSEAHSPCSCMMWQLWSKKCRDESETVNWITVNTKPCPKCHKHVEKNGGCNLVSCVCGQAFCWLCGGATGRNHTWTSISGHSCGRYEESDIKKSERAKHELHRYIHYHNRYKVHLDSFKQESKLKAKVIDRISISENQQSIITDYSWVLNGMERLFRSRHVLAYSYPFAFYMFGNELFNDEMTEREREIKKNLFEDQQQQFEFNVERLSSALEEPFDTYHPDKIQQIRLRVINLTVLVDNLCLKMYQCIENDLLGSLHFTIHNIAPYISKGVEKASELSFSWGSDSSLGSSIQSNNTDASMPQSSTIGGTEPGKPGSLRRNLSGVSESGYSRRKRTRKDVNGDDFVDLNLPPRITHQS